MKISEILERLNAVRESRCLAEELLNKASEVFIGSYPLEKFEENYKEYWKNLFFKCLYDSRFYAERKKESASIEKIFIKVRNAYISRREFEGLLKPFAEAVEVFIKRKKEEEAKLQSRLANIYEEYFASHFTDFSFIFCSEQIKQGFLEFLSTNYEESPNNP